MGIRGKLFLHVGAILCLVAFLSYFLPWIFIPQEVDRMAKKATALLPPGGTTETLMASFRELRLNLVHQISLSLLGAIALTFLFGLFLLNRMAKKMVLPIVDLAHASERVSRGEWEEVVFPHVKGSGEVSVLVHAFENMVVGLKERETIRGVLNKVVSREIASQLLNSKVELGGEKRVVTVLFSDIRGFTHLSEGVDPALLIGRLNAYMTRMCTIIDARGGVVDKFVGDAIMALFGAPVTLENQEERAVQAAQEMQGELAAWNRELRERGEITFEMGIGIHTGEVLSGNMGSSDRLNYTVIGANVNLASRLCGVAKAGQIVVSEETKRGCGGRFTFALLPAVPLKGIEKSVSLYEVGRIRLS